MALTGTGVSLNNSRFGGVESYARGAASDGTTAYHFGRTQGYTLNLGTGAATASGSAWSGSGTIRGATYHNSQVLVYIDTRDIYVWTPGTGFGGTAEISNLRYATGSGFSGDPSINGFASYNGVLYVADSNADHLFSVGSDGILTAVGSGFGNINIGGMTSHDSQLLATNNTDDRLVVVDTAAGTVTNVANNALTGDRTIDFLLSHGDELYGGRFSDGLIRFYDVAWDAMIADFEVDEGESTTIDLGAISRDADSFSITSPPSWLSVSGTNLVVTNAPAVNADTTTEITLLATRDSVSDTLTHDIVVRDVPTTPTITITTADTDIREGEFVDFRITFSESVSEFVLSDITVTGATASNLAGSGSTYDLVTIAGSGAGSIVISINENVVSPGNAAASETFTRNALPTVTITTTEAYITEGEDFDVTFQWSEVVSGFATDDVTVIGATKGTFTPVDADTYRLRLTAGSGAGTITVRVRANAVTLRNVLTSENFTRNAIALRIVPAGPILITVGTTDYEFPITIVDSTANTDVTLDGDWEGFYMNWDQPNGTLYIQSEEVTRLVGEYVWLVTATEGNVTVTEEIVYSVIPAAPIIRGITETVAIFRDVEVNLDIPILNTPDASSVEGLQVGTKYEPAETFEGLKVSGMLPSAAVLTETTFTAQTTAENPAARVTSDINCELMAGSPPQIASPAFTPRGGYGVLEFTDVNHALGYEWTLGEGDEALWNNFSNARPVINPGDIEITPGNLNVTLTFPHINGAATYEYMLESEMHTVDWTVLQTTLSNNMITTIIPNLEDGVEYTLRLRVASPWIGTPISVTVYGGRLAFVMHGDGANSYLYIFSTGVADGGTATRLKRLLLPTTFTGPDRGGIAVDGDDVYIVNVEPTAEKALYKFDWTAFDDGDRVNNARRNPFSSGIFFNASSFGMGVRGDELYIYINNSGTMPWDFGMHVIDKDQSDGAILTPSRSTGTALTGITHHSGVSLSDHTLFVVNNSGEIDFYPADFDDGDSIASSQIRDLPNISSSNLRGHTVVGEAEQVYAVTDDTAITELRRYQINDTDYTQVWSVHLPTGLTDPYRIDFLR